MSVILETSLGDITIDLFVKDCPNTCKNFLKLCKIKYYNNCLFHNIQKDYIVQTGDPTGTGKGGESIYGILYGEQANFFADEIKPGLRHKKPGTVAMANPGPNLNASQFYITVGENMTSLDDQHTVFGIVAEGLETVMKINDAFTDQEGRPLQVIRIRHTLILDDPFPDPPGISVPSRSPSPKPEKHMLAEDFDIKDIPQDEETLAKMKEELAAKEARAREEILAVVDDLPDADVKPPDNVLFVCKLNPVTTSEDLEIIFSRFGNIISCEVIRDWKTKESLQYAFIEFETAEMCEEAYFKMNDVLVDDRRIHVDFSQSVAKEKFKAAGGWKGYFSQKAAEMSGKGGPKYESKNRSTNSKYDMLFDDDEDRGRSKRKRDDDSDSGSDRKRHKRDDKRRDKRRSRSRSRDKRRSRSPQRDKRRSRSRSRDQKRNKDRARSPRDRRSRSRSRDRKRSRVWETESSREIICEIKTNFL